MARFVKVSGAVEGQPSMSEFADADLVFDLGGAPKAPRTSSSGRSASGARRPSRSRPKSSSRGRSSTRTGRGSARKAKSASSKSRSAARSSRSSRGADPPHQSRGQERQEQPAQRRESAPHEAGVEAQGLTASVRASAEALKLRRKMRSEASAKTRQVKGAAAGRLPSFFSGLLGCQVQRRELRNLQTGCRARPQSRRVDVSGAPQPSQRDKVASVVADFRVARISERHGPTAATRDREAIQRAKCCDVRGVSRDHHALRHAPCMIPRSPVADPSSGGSSVWN